MAGDELYELLGGSLDGIDVVNLDGDYTYMTAGYYASLDAELRGERVAPTTADAIDAYVVPLAMERAARAGIAVPTYELVTDRFPAPPFMAYPVNPFSTKGELVEDAETLEARRKGLTYTGKYAVLVQRLPVDYRIDVVRIVLGRTLVPEYESFAKQVFDAFRIPLLKARVIVASKTYQLSSIEPLPLDDLTLNEKALVQGVDGWRS